MKKTSDLGGIVAMMAATAAFVVGDCFMKLVTEDLPPFEVLFLRGIAAVLACALLVTVFGQWSAIAGVREGRTVLRALGETFSTLCYVVALARLPIADVIAILQTAPLILIVGAAVLLHEKIGLLRITLVLLGFAGAVLVAQPGSGGISAAVMLAFATAVLVAARDLVGRGVPADVPVLIVVLATLLIETVIAGAMSVSFENWHAPSGRHLLQLGTAAVFLTLGHGGLFLAYRLGRTAAVAPFFYSFALWGVIAGLIVWGAWPNALACAGIALIVASGVGVVVTDPSRSRTRLKLKEAL